MIITKSHRLRAAASPHKFIFSQFWRLKSEIKVLPELLPSETSLLDSQMAPSPCAFARSSSMSVHLPPLLIQRGKGTIRPTIPPGKTVQTNEKLEVIVIVVVPQGLLGWLSFSKATSGWRVSPGGPHRTSSPDVKAI